jgi:putative transposase
VAPANKEKVTVRSDQGSQFSSYDWQALRRADNPQASMTRRGNSHDNAVAESFFRPLPPIVIKMPMYSNLDSALNRIDRVRAGGFLL